MRRHLLLVISMVWMAWLGCGEGERSSAPGAQASSATEPAELGKGGEELKLRPVTDSTRLLELFPIAKKLLEEHADDPVGTEIPFEHEGEAFIARIEIHENPHGGPKKPWGPHRGVTVYYAAR